MSQPLNISAQKKRQLELFRHYINGLRGLHELKRIQWQITTRCNLTCLDCSHTCHVKRGTELSPHVFLTQLGLIFEKYQQNDVYILIGGGEPLLMDDLADIGKAISKAGFKWGIQTNGTLLNQSLLRNLMKSGMSGIELSLDGDADNHNMLRNSTQAFEKSLEALKLAAAEKDLKVHLHTRVNHYSIADLPSLFEKVQSLNIASWTLSTLNPPVNLLLPEDILPSREDYEYMLEFVKQARSNGFTEISINDEGFLGDYENEVRNGFFFCKTGIQEAAVLADGSVTGGIHLDASFVQGNINQESFPDIWEKKFRIMRDRSWTKTGVCAFCSFYKFCQGSALHLWDGYNIKLSVCHLSLLSGKESF